MSEMGVTDHLTKSDGSPEQSDSSVMLITWKVGCQKVRIKKWWSIPTSTLQMEYFERKLKIIQSKEPTQTVVNDGYTYSVATFIRYHWMGWGSIQRKWIIRSQTAVQFSSRILFHIHWKKISLEAIENIIQGIKKECYYTSMWEENRTTHLRIPKIFNMLPDNKIIKDLWQK